MKITTLCSSCKKSLKIKTSAKSRAELQQERGTEITLTCNNCATINKKHINRISAEVDNKIILLSIVAGVVVSGISLFLWGL